MFERFPVEKLHHDKLLAVGLADVVDRADVRMVESRRSSRLSLKSFNREPILQDAFGEKLERNVAAEAVVVGFVDDTHAAATQLVDHGVMRDGLPNHGANPRRS